MADVELDVTFESSTVNLDTDFGTVYVLDGNVAVKIIADNYSNTSTYLVGAYVIYEGLLYRCITAIDEPEEFNPVKWEQVKLANEVDDIRKALSNKADIASLSEVATSGSYTDLTNKPTIPDAQVNSDWNAETGVSVILNKPSIYTQSQVDAIAVLKADKSNTYTKSQVDNLIDSLPNPMIFKGTLGENGTITSLPNASASNVGHTYKVITAGTYAGQEAKVGDTFTSAKPVGASEYSWILFSEGDTDTDTWRNIKVNGTEVLGNGISSGSADFVNTDNIEVTFDTTGNKVKIATKNIYTQTQVDTSLAAKADKNNPVITGALNMNKASPYTLGNYSATIGYMGRASGYVSTSIGMGNQSTGSYSTSIGYGTVSAGTASTAIGHHTDARNNSQLAFGQYNILDPSTASGSDRGTYIEIVGNGKFNTETLQEDRSNARTLDWQGNEWLAGDLTINGTTSLTSKINTYDSIIGNSLSATLTAGQTSVTIQDASITAGSILSVFTDVYGLQPLSVSATTGSVTLTFTTQGVDIHIIVEVK